jgi:hypothetical protein
MLSVLVLTRKNKRYYRPRRRSRSRSPGLWKLGGGGFDVADRREARNLNVNQDEQRFKDRGRERRRGRFGQEGSKQEKTHS